MLVVDRIEDKTAVVEVSVDKFINVPLENISGDVANGSVLRKAGPNRYAVDESATNDRTARVQAKARKLFK